MKRNAAVYIFGILSMMYFLSILWVNFNASQWYSMDMLTYSYEGRLMSDGHTFFPDGWIFGNQYHIVSSPNLSALFYPIFGDSVKSMALASTLNTVLIIISFVWCIGGAVGYLGLFLGVLCLIGGTIFGTDAAKYISGYQVLYTMSSFYSCYLIGILLSMGCWLRLRKGKKVLWAFVALALVLNFALGMQSVREILVLNIPLLILELFYDCADMRKEGATCGKSFNRSSLWFAVALMVLEVAGYLFMKSLHVAATPIIGDLQLDLSLGGLASNFWASTKNILRISGLAIAMDGLKFLPLSICALLVAFIVLWSLIKIIVNKDDGALAKLILFSFVSVLCVYGVGIFFMRTRDIYYFVYWLLAAVSVCYAFKNIGNKFKNAFLTVLFAICLVNYGYNFIPDFKSYSKYHGSLKEFSMSLVDRGISVIYVDANPIFAAASNDKIVSQSFWLDVNLKSGYPLTFFPSDKNIVIYDDEHYDNALICFSNYYLNYLNSSALKEYKDILMSKLVYFDEYYTDSNHFILYRPTERIIAP